MPRGENRPSVLLTREENEQVFSLIGPKCQSLATTVVQLFTTDGPAHLEWRKRDTGVLCLIKDNVRRSYFFRIYCLNRKAMIWQHEVYIQIEYKNPRDYLHTFEAEEYMTAFNFANPDEARVLKNILMEKIEIRKQRREERRQKSILAARANNNIINNGTSTLRHNGAPAPVPPAPVTPAPPPPVTKDRVTNYGTKNKKGKPTRKLTKHDIGMPQNFQHVSHIGWNAESGFDLENVDEQAMNTFFSKAGISETQLQDHDTREFIYDFINTHGGLDAVKEELHDEGSPTKESGKVRAPPPVPSRSPAPAHPPGPPSRAPPPPPSRALPPPPLRTPPPPRPLQPPTTAPPSAPPPPPPPPCDPAPPPPPAPAPPAPPAPPPPPADAPHAPAAPDSRSALMESIRAGNKTLKRVEVAAKPADPEPSRGDLLSEIRQGIELRSVPKDTTSAAPERRMESCGLAGALQRALQERNRATHSSDSDLSDETTSDGEWDE